MVTQQWTSIDIPNGLWTQYTPGGTTVNVSSAESLTMNGYAVFYNKIILEWFNWIDVFIDNWEVYQTGYMLTRNHIISGFSNFSIYFITHYSSILIDSNNASCKLYFQLASTSTNIQIIQSHISGSTQRWGHICLFGLSWLK